LFLEGNLCFAECAPELPGCPRASSSIAGCHLLTVKRLSVAEPRGAGISCCVSVSVVLLRQLVVADGLGMALLRDDFFMALDFYDFAV